MRKHYIILLFILLFFVPKVKAQVDINDSLALVDLYNSTDGPHWAVKHNWLTTNPVSTWNKVRVSKHRVAALLLSSNKLSGVLPASLGSLTKLTQLELDHNKITGIIPPEIGKMQSLAELYLNNNQLSGHIPPELSKLANLGYLILNANFTTYYTGYRNECYGKPQAMDDMVTNEE